VLVGFDVVKCEGKDAVEGFVVEGGEDCCSYEVQTEEDILWNAKESLLVILNARSYFGWDLNKLIDECEEFQEKACLASRKKLV